MNELLLLFFVTLLDLMLLFWEVLCLFGFLLRDMLLVWLLKGVKVGGVWFELCFGAVLPGFDGVGGVDWVSGPGGGIFRVRLNRKTPAHLVRHGSGRGGEVQSRPHVWKRLRVWEGSASDPGDAKVLRVHQSGDQHASVMDGVRRPTSPGCA